MDEQGERCRELWRAVLAQVVRDAADKSGVIRGEAIGWLQHPGNALWREEIYDRAGMSLEPWKPEIMRLVGAKITRVKPAICSIIARHGDD